MQTEQLLCWSGMTDTEHSTTFSLNEEEEEQKFSNYCGVATKLLGEVRRYTEINLLAST